VILRYLIALLPEYDELQIPPALTEAGEECGGGCGAGLPMVMTALSPVMSLYRMVFSPVTVFGGRRRHRLLLRAAALLRKVTGRNHGLKSEEHHADVSRDSHISN